MTGATGFVGGRLAERLCLEEGARVRGLVRNWTKAVWLSRYPVELQGGDLSDDLVPFVTGCDVVFHCASGGETPEGYRSTIVDGTRRLLEACVKAGVERLVHVSSVAVHGACPPDNADETAPRPRLGRAYSDSKIEAEDLVQEFGQRFGLKTSILRPTFVWGPRSALFTVRPLLAMRRGTFKLVDEGRGDCHAIYIENLVDALLLAGLLPAAVGEAFLITDGERLTWRDFFGHYASWLGVSRFPSISSRSSLVSAGAWGHDRLTEVLNRLQGNPAPLPRRVVRRAARESLTLLNRWGYPSSWDLAKFARRGAIDISKAQTRLGYSPRYSVAQGMSDTETWVRDQLGHDLGLDPSGLAHAAVEHSGVIADA